MVEYIMDEFEDSFERGWRGPGWYFWDETQVYVYGPYNSKEEAECETVRYAKEVLGG